MKRASLANRLTFLFALTSGAMLLGLGLLIGDLVKRHFTDLDAETLGGKLELVQSALGKVRQPSDLDLLTQDLHAALVGHPGLALAVRWPDKATLVSSAGTDFPRIELEQGAQDAPHPVRVHSAEGKPYIRISAAIPLGMPDATPAVVDVALDTSQHYHFISTFQNALWIIVIIAVILSGFLGRLAVQRGLAPLRAIRQQAAAITAHRLSQRLPDEAVPVELEELVRTLNIMLARLEESFQRLSHFSSDIAHELRTPVSNLLMQTQVTLSKPRSADEYREILYSNAEEFTRLSRMIADMLFLAKAEHGLVAPFDDVVDLAHEVLDLFSFFEVLAEGKNIALHLTGAANVCGDRMLLRRAISNLLSNAIVHSQSPGEVGVEIRALENGDIAIRVTNSGEPIAKEHIPRLFDRFYRVDAARTESSEGAGLGLAITKSIVALHGGSIGVEPDAGLTCFEMRLPASRARTV